MRDFGSLSSRRQTACVRRALSRRLESTECADAPFALVSNAFNMTFKMGVPEPIAIRVNINSRRTKSELCGEQAFLELVGERTALRVPRPAPIFNGQAVAELDVPGLNRPCLAIAYSWLPGRHGRLAPASWRRVGDALRQIHAASASELLPPGRERPILDDVLDGLPWSLDAPECRDALELAREVLDRLHRAPRQLVHFDLHVWNTKFDGNSLAVFDFDDAVWSVPAVDVAQVLYYVRRSPHPQACEAALWEGLQADPDSYSADQRDLEALVMGRNLLLACDLAVNVSAGSSDELAAYVETTRLRAEAFLKTGVFDGRIAAP